VVSGFGSGCGADIRFWRYFLVSGGDISYLQTFEADFEGFQFGYIPFSFPCFGNHTDCNYHHINILTIKPLKR
jgi:hypothetical protein